MANLTDIQEEREAAERAGVSAAPEEAEAGVEGGEAENVADPTAVGEAMSGAAATSLDEQLAGLADELLEGEDAGKPGSGPFSPPMPAVAALQPETYGPKAPPDAEPAAKGDIEKSVAPVAEAGPVAETEDRANEVEEQSGGEGVAATDEAVVPVVRKGILPRLRTPSFEPAAALAYPLLAAVSSPLAGRPAQVRSAVGWIAACNLFLAACVWIYVLFMRPTEAPPPAPTGPVAQHAGGVTAPVAIDGD